METAQSNTSSERPGRSSNGWPVLGVALVALAVATGLIVWGAVEVNVPLVVVGSVVAVVAVVFLAGLILVEPNEARVLQLLGGSYAGTLREPGLRWMNPLNSRRKITTRIRNHETARAKVNDADGNPIEISAVIVWQVEDTARAVFDVDDFEEFVAVQTEAAVRHIAGSYPYDGALESISLRQNADQITTELSAEVHARVQSAGVRVIETRINQLAYAPEIAQAMLRRQQAGAVIAAREQIVQGAVSMVGTALERLEAEHTVSLDEDRKAVMVSNLLVVLCGDQSAQPVLNTGSLYQ
ncbi:SPFH domain-containing protein [Rhodococcus coprophilus]|uniref:HflK protein n=1 Tax=Rhodococcus coprophilus TaxID=38310 RepID=A0A2X4TV15_9NOCA|nr:SPFH domain-containing protein [Rhodococcus coprophilus]MBM7457985.1 regulator of protease activity HflC (stomatin/prohibitin superfamily) [Rhodococcus coprophilus]SQI30841.1 HflK protein [Rhodococcus coprophilus]